MCRLLEGFSACGMRFGGVEDRGRFLDVDDVVSGGMGGTGGADSWAEEGEEKMEWRAAGSQRRGSITGTCPRRVYIYSFFCNTSITTSSLVFQSLRSRRSRARPTRTSRFRSPHVPAATDSRKPSLARVPVAWAVLESRLGQDDGGSRGERGSERLRGREGRGRDDSDETRTRRRFWNLEFNWNRVRGEARNWE